MTGVEILNEYAVASPWAFSWGGFGITFGIFVILGIIGWIKYGGAAIAVLCTILGILFGTLAGAVFGCAYPTGDDAITRYEVVVDDTVSMNDFYEKYEIIEQKGKILVVEERE